MDYAWYIAAGLGALTVYGLMPTEKPRPTRLIGLGGLVFLVGFLIWLVGRVEAEARPSVYYYIFTGIAALSAVRVITHTRPVYSALHFVMTVLAVCGLLIVLEAEFMAFAAIIIYAGAILVTYLFVIMLATMPQVEGQEEQAPIYDRLAREPVSAVVLGFALIAVLSNVIFTTNTDLPAQTTDAPKIVAVRTSVERMPDRVHSALIERDLLDPQINASLRVRDTSLLAYDRDVELDIDEVQEPIMSLDLTDARYAGLVSEIAAPNIDQVGVALFEGHELGIELAGVILLLSMVGAIVIGRKEVEKIGSGGGPGGDRAAAPAGRGDEATVDSMDQYPAPNPGGAENA